MQTASLPRKALHRRTSLDRSQITRHIVQVAFALLNLWIGVQFWLWVRSIELGGAVQGSRPAGVDGWLPIAGLMNTKYWLASGQIPAIHPAAMFLFLGFVAGSLLIKKAFCSWLCPVGTLEELLARVGRQIFGRNFSLPRWVDLPLRGLKYLLLGFFFVIIVRMSAEELNGFMQTPYGLLADVKMLNFFRHIGETGLIVVALLGVGSVLVENFWCRYLCPYGALMGVVSLLSPVKIRRDADACIDCGKCARVCPAQLPVDQLIQIRSAECTACMTCVAACPAENALQLSLPPWKGLPKESRWTRRRVSPLVAGAIVLGCFGLTVLIARLSGHWQTMIPAEIYRELVPKISELSHPGL